MTINATTGLLSWTPTASQVGQSAVSVTVSDGQGGSVTQSFTISVNTVAQAPKPPAAAP